MARNLDTQALLAHGRFLRAVARDLLHDEHIAEDVVQETWIRAMRSGPTEAGKLRAWLAAVTRNLARDRGRSESARRVRERKVARPEAIDPSRRFEEHQRVAEMVAALEQPYRDMLILRYVDDLSPTAIGRMLGVPAATIRTRIHRALAMLRTRLDTEHNGDRRAWGLLLLPLIQIPRPPISLPLLGGLFVSKLKYVAVVALLLTLWGVSGLSSKRPARAVGQRELASTAAPSPATKEQSDTQGTSTLLQRRLGGRVVFGDGAPAAGARVEVFPHFPERFWSSPRPAHAASVRTVECDADGRFAMSVPSSTALLLRAGHENSVAERPVRAATTDRPDLEIVLVPTVSATLRVLGDTDKPVAGAEVRIGAPLFDDAGEPTLIGFSDRAGRATIHGITANPWGHGVTVRHPDYAVATYVSASLPNSDWTVRLQRGHSYKGVVLDAQRRPVPSARLRWVCEHERFGSGEVYADARGRFVFRALPPHPCFLFVEGEDRGHTFRKLAAPPHPPEILLDDIRERSGIVVNEAGEPVPGVLVLALAPDMVKLRTSFSNGITQEGLPNLLRTSISDHAGRFAFPGLSTNATRIGISSRMPYRRLETTGEDDALRIVVAPAPVIRGRVVDADGQPVADARVVRPGGFGYLRYTDGDGRFEIHPLRARDGSYRTKTEIRITKPGFARLKHETDDRAPVFQMQRVGMVRGRLVDPAGKPVAGARVSLGDEYQFSDHDGRFHAWLRAGTVGGRARRDGYRPLQIHFTASGADHDLGSLTLEPHAPATLRGVISGPDGQPLAGVLVVASSEGSKVWRGDYKERSDFSGRYEFPLLSEDRIRIEVRHDGFAPYRKLGIAVNGHSELDIQLESGAPVAGTVVDHEGASVAGAQVVLIPDEDDFDNRIKRTTDKHGRFSYPTVASGPCRILAAEVIDDECRAWMWQRAMGGEGHLVLRLAPPTWISGRLIDSDGQPLEGVYVSANIEDPDNVMNRTSIGTPSAESTTDASGRFRIQSLWGDRCRLRFRIMKEVAGVARALPSGGSWDTGREHTIRFDRGLVIEGRVLSPTGEVVDDAQVYIDNDEGYSASLHADATGTFRISGLEPGSYRIVVWANNEKIRNNTIRPTWKREVKAVVAGAPALVIRLDDWSDRLK